VNYEVAMKVLTDCGANPATPQAEKTAIDMALRTLSDASVTQANSNVVMEIKDAVVDFCATHFRTDEQAFRDHGFADAEASAAAHEILLGRLRAARALRTDIVPLLVPRWSQG
jgi:hemerythrin